VTTFEKSLTSPEICYISVNIIKSLKCKLATFEKGLTAVNQSQVWLWGDVKGVILNSSTR
jgi:hypothetical protein